MATRTKRICGKHGCNKLTDCGYCDAHRIEKQRLYTKEANANRESSAKRGYDRRWQKTREHFLNANPSCVFCLKEKQQHIPATVVDHIIPHRGDMSLFWDQENWQPLCKRCHDRKTARGE